MYLSLSLSFELLTNKTSQNLNIYSQYLHHRKAYLIRTCPIIWNALIIDPDIPLPIYQYSNNTNNCMKEKDLNKFSCVYK